MCPGDAYWRPLIHIEEVGKGIKPQSQAKKISRATLLYAYRLTMNLNKSAFEACGQFWNQAWCLPLICSLLIQMEDNREMLRQKKRKPHSIVAPTERRGSTSLQQSPAQGVQHGLQKLAWGPSCLVGSTFHPRECQNLRWTSSCWGEGSRNSYASVVALFRASAAALSGASGLSTYANQQRRSQGPHDQTHSLLLLICW